MLDAADPENQYPAALSAALRFIAYRPRSVAEVRRRLARQWPPPVNDRVIHFLQENNYLDDAAFAQLWRRGREQRKPRGQRALRSELRQLGVDREIIDETLADFDAPTNAYKAAAKPAARLLSKGVDAEQFRRKLSAHLQRRGFDYSVITPTVNQLWNETAAN